MVYTGKRAEQLIKGVMRMVSRRSFLFSMFRALMSSLIPLKNGRVDQAKLKERITLSNLQIDSLTSILFNVTYRGPFFTEVDVKCYNPRNAILFIDETGKELAFIELCFECMKHRLRLQKNKSRRFLRTEI